MELIDRYIYSVTRRLPEKQREDINKELRSLIDDMLAQRAGEGQASAADIEAVLNELGDPSVLAAKYSGKPRYLIGPGLFDAYITVLSIALVAAVFGILVALTVNYATTPPVYLGELFGNIIGSVISTVFQVFAWVTVIFALIEHFAPDTGVEKWKKHGWKPADLPEIPVKSAMIKRSEPIVGIIFIVIFCIILNFSPSLFSVFYLKDIPVTLFNLDLLRHYMPLINIAFAASIIKEIMKLIYGRYNIRFGVISIILSSISFVLVVIVFSNFDIWNRDLVSSIQQVFGASLPDGYDAVQLVMLFAKVVLGIIIFSFVVGTMKTVIKTLKFSTFDLKRFINVDR
jgi:hypothetical protein